MRYIFLIMLFGFGSWLYLPAESAHANVRITTNFHLIVPEDCGHQTPLTEFMRRFEQIVRHSSNIDNTASSRVFTVQLNSQLPPGQYRFFKNSDGMTILEISADLQGVLNTPLTGRVLTSALLQSRMNKNIAQPLPRAAYWVADGLWAEFILRETLPFHIMHFNYLAALRNLAESGFRIRIDQNQLTAPTFRNIRSPEWVLYTQRSQLMLKIAVAFAGRQRSNLLKDYLYLLENGKLAPSECFELTFTRGNRRQKLANDRAAADEIMETAALMLLFSQAAPINPELTAEYLKNIFQVQYLTERSPVLQKAQLSDLPLLVQKYDSCSKLPKQKIRELNNIIPIVSGHIKPEIMELIGILSQLAMYTPEDAAAKIKQNVSSIQEKLVYLEQVDKQLQNYERSLQPPLYIHRYSVGDIMQTPPLPGNINKFIKANQDAGVL